MFLVLQEIVVIVFSPLIVDEQISYLEVLICQYLEALKRMLPSQKSSVEMQLPYSFTKFD